MADGSEIYFIGGAPCGGKSTARACNLRAAWFSRL